jgi:hypothetical protein
LFCSRIDVFVYDAVTVTRYLMPPTFVFFFRSSRVFTGIAESTFGSLVIVSIDLMEVTELLWRNSSLTKATGTFAVLLSFLSREVCL